MPGQPLPVHPLDDLEDEMLDLQPQEGEENEAPDGGDADRMDVGEWGEEEEEEEEEEDGDDFVEGEDHGRAEEDGDVGAADEGNPQDPGRAILRGWQRLGQGFGNRVLIQALYGGMAETNEELVSQLFAAGNIRSEQVRQAFLACPRGSFVPPRYEEEAYMDCPIRLDHLEFNISAPHMHAMCIQSLDVQPGQRFLDIGSGCGVVSAIAAHLVGPTGFVVGVDVLPEAVKLSTNNLEKLRHDSEDYARTACECHFEEHNVFLPHPTYSLFDRICVGAQCPQEQLPSLLKLLRPAGGVMVVPVGSELKLITRLSSGKLLEKTIAHVRFGELVLPSDARIVLETIKVTRDAHGIVSLPDSTLASDMAEATGVAINRRESTSSCSSAGSSFSTHASLAFSPLLDSRSGEALGQPDCALIGPGWSIPAHMALLKVRSQHFRARFESGMRDAEVPDMPVPDHFSKATVEAFLHYVYNDSLPEELPVQEVAELVHAATFFNSQRLVVLCEAALAKELLSKEAEVEELAPQLLAMADEVGLHHLRNAALNYITQHYGTVSKTAAFEQLSKAQVAMVANTACQYYMQAISSLEEITGCANGKS